MLLVHKLIKFFDDGLQEWPVLVQEVWKLSNNIHDVGSDQGFVRLSLLLLAKVQQFFDYRNNELIFLIC